MLKNPDLDGFPVLRIDQIPLIHTDILERANVEALNLIESLKKDGENSQKSLVYYLYRQLNEMEKEVAKRAAEDRVMNLLSGTERALNTTEEIKIELPKKTQPISFVRAHDIAHNAPEKRIGTSQSDYSSERSDEKSIETATRPMLIPLPSELRRRVLASAAQALPSAEASEQNEMESASVISSRSVGGDHPTSPVSSVHSGVSKPRRPKSGQPTRRSMAALEENFGSEFVVGATERKKRFYPKKVVQETEEQVRERVRESRRQVAMKRLLERKERQVQQKEAQKRKKLKALSEQKNAMSKAMQQRNGTSADDENPLDESSESESVSGGDDDEVVPVQVPAQIRKHMVFDVEPATTIDIHVVPSRENSPVLDVEGEAASESRTISVQSSLEISPSSVGLSEKSDSDSRPGEVSSSSALAPIPIAPTESEVLTGAIQTKNMAALNKLRKLKEKRRGEAETIGGAAFDAEVPSSSSPSSSNSPSSCRPLLGSSQSTPMIRTFSTEVEEGENEGVAEIPQRAEVEKHDFQSKLREVLTEISQTTLTAATVPAIPTSIAVPGDASSLPSSSSGVDQGFTVPLQRGNKQHQSQADLFIPDSIPTAQKMSIEHYFLENSIIEESHNESGGEVVYKCSMGPDDLPGLKAWTLVSVKGSTAGDVKWVVNLQQYFDLLSIASVTEGAIIAGEEHDAGMRSRLTMQRAKARRTSTFGLILLAKICEPLMRGESSPTTMLTEELFRSRWRSQLSLFDSLVADCSDAQEDLFRNVTTCGNMYAVCKKLENLLRTSFVITTDAHVAAESATTRTTPREECCIDNRGSELHMPPLPIMMDVHENDDSDEDDPIDPDSSTDVFSARLHHTTASTKSNEDPMHVSKSGEGQGTFVTGISTVTENRKTDTVPTGKLAARHVKGVARPMAAPVKTVPSADPPTRKLGRRESKQLAAQALSTVMAETTSKLEGSHEEVPVSQNATKITDIFTNIAEIFPAVRLLMRHMKSGCKPGDHDKVAVTLIECMTTQLKLYEEWIEVMDDYATVFCHDKNKGVPSQMDHTADGANALVYGGGTKALHYRVKSSRPEVANIVTDVFSNHLVGWEELPQGLGLGTSWNVLWSWAKPRINIKHLNMFQKINHFHDSKQLTRKDLLKKNLGRLTDVMGNKISQQFEIMPKTFLLPNEYTSFVREYTAIEAAKSDPSTLDPDSIKNIWIMKPVGLSRGRGITLVQDITSLTYSHTSVLQKYVDRPLCLGGYKFDLRLYIVVTSFQPLEAFIYNDGFARVSTEKYRVDSDSLTNQFIHLTNSSIQKNSVTGPTTDNPLMQGDVNESNGSKIGLMGPTGLWRRLQKEGINTEQVWNDICLLVVKSLVAVDDKIEHQPCCFELFGYDVLLDADLRPWLIEVNASPSLARSNQLDVRVKNNLIKEIIELVDPPPFDRLAFAKIMRKRLKDIQNKTFSMGKGDPTLERDLRLMLGDHIPRRYGEEPKSKGSFETLAPNTKMYNLCMKLKGKLVKGSN